MFCNNCGKEVNEDSVFCNYCGNCLKSVETKQENAKPSLKEEIKVAWTSAPEKLRKKKREREQKESIERLEEMQGDLKPKDGRYHVVLIKSQSKSLSDNNVYVLKLENILEAMQNNGYEIVDIKIIGIQWGGATIGSEMVVIYK